MLVLLGTGANVNMITPKCVVALGLQMGPSHGLAGRGYNDRPAFQL